MKIKDFERDHVDIKQQVDELEKLIDAGVGNNAKAISQMLTRVSINIRLHLASEGHSLYPVLEQAGDAEITAISTRFKDEMTGLYEAFAKYIGDWRDSANIETDPERFQKETKALFGVLAERIDREENELHLIAKQVPAIDP